MYRTRDLLILLLTLVTTSSVVVGAEEPKPHRAETGATAATADGANLTPAERMARRFPQKVRVGDLFGLPLQDEDDRVLGRVEQVVRTDEGRIVLVTTWDRGWLGRGGRPVGIPLETVAILGRHLDVLDLSRAEVAALSTWAPGAARAIPRDQTISIAISRR